ncbi:probable carbohydrate esterase At4g34215 [Cucumis melo]|uniref:Probable carbohydrate esterase At4g34215 n=1 Tax=Cucumis melo TaxID=3656 RepID=A0ABM3KMF1_CUCME|nr:probable carbohydrate esterase At4g34215 [Cucumis melo]
MAGRGGVVCPDLCLKNCTWDRVIPQPSQSQPSILRFTVDFKWEEAREPLHWDIDPSKTNGVGPEMAFANQVYAMASQSVGVTGLVPCAIGGTQLKTWLKGTDRYTSLIGRINASLESRGNLGGFIWFQGNQMQLRG